MLITSIFSFSHSVFYLNEDRNHYFSNIKFFVYNSFEFGPVQKFVIWKRLNPSPNKPWFLCVCSTRLLKTLQEIEILLVMSNSPFPTLFSTYSEKVLPFLSNLKLSSANFSFGNRLTETLNPFFTEHGSGVFTSNCVSWALGVSILP